MSCTSRSFSPFSSALLSSAASRDAISSSCEVDETVAFKAPYTIALILLSALVVEEFSVCVNLIGSVTRHMMYASTSIFFLSEV